uniref:Ig-like domain-containing protein n=1 Tax=Balaenoptera musculus TaxID=9771 RepID=A0A8C0CQU7_BALMU
MADTGPYGAMISTPTSSLFTNYDLRIFSVPQVQVDSFICEHSTCNVTLRCSVEAGGENTIYGWTPVGPRAIFPQEGSVLSGSQNSCDLNWTYTCTAMNPVSKSISSLNLVRQLCAGSEAAAGTFFPVTWILLGKWLLLLIFLRELGTWYIQTQVLRKPFMSSQGNENR